MAKIGLGDDRTAALQSGYVNVDGTVREITEGYIGTGDGDKEQIWPPSTSISDSQLNHWFAIDEGEGTEITDSIGSLTGEFEGSPTWMPDSEFVGGWALDTGENDGWVTENVDSGHEWTICGWLEVGSTQDTSSTRFGAVYTVGTPDSVSEHNDDGDMFSLTYNDNNEIAAAMQDSGALSSSGVSGVGVSRGDHVFAAVTGNTSTGDIDIYVYNSDGELIGSEYVTENSTFRPGSISDPVFYSNYNNSDSEHEGHDGYEIACGFTDTILSQSEIEEVLNKTMP